MPGTQKRLDKHSCYCTANLFSCFVFHGDIKSCQQGQAAFENWAEKSK